MSNSFWIQIRTDVLSVLIWVQTVGIVYQLVTKVPASKERVTAQCFFSPTEKIDEVECLIEQPSLSRRHHVLTGHGYELLALGVQSYNNIKDLAGSKLEQKFLDLAGVRKLNKEEVQSNFIFSSPKQHSRRAVVLPRLWYPQMLKFLG